MVFLQRPICAGFLAIGALLLVLQLYFGIRAARRGEGAVPH